jgi:hypothetical protein
MSLGNLAVVSCQGTNLKQFLTDLDFQAFCSISTDVGSIPILLVLTSLCRGIRTSYIVTQSPKRRYKKVKKQCTDMPASHDRVGLDIIYSLLQE